MSNLTFIDLFCGIGGMRLGLEHVGAHCVFSCEIDPYAAAVYEKNFGEKPYGDIRDPKVLVRIPKKFDVLSAGFPCQAFSIAGKRKGFKDKTRGTLFFDVAQIAEKHLPQVVFGENVKGLVSHAGGVTLRTIIGTLEEIGYYVPTPEVLNAKFYGIPQNRERVFILGFLDHDAGKRFVYPHRRKITKTFGNVQDNDVSADYYISAQYLRTLKKHKARHAAAGNGFGYCVITRGDVANAVVRGGMGKERNLVYDPNCIGEKKNKDFLRVMTPNEWRKLQGFPEWFKIDPIKTHAYNQFGNSVAVPVIKALAKEVIKVI